MYILPLWQDSGYAKNTIKISLADFVLKSICTDALPFSLPFKSTLIKQYHQ